MRRDNSAKWGWEYFLIWKFIMDGEKLNLEGKHANSWITIRPRGSDFTTKFGDKEVATDQKGL